MAAAVAAACGGGARVDSLHNAAVAPPHELALAIGSAVSVYAIADGKVTLERTVALPDVPAELAWVGAAPVVLLGGNGAPIAAMGSGVVGRIGATFEPFAPAPASAWAAPPPPDADASSSMYRHSPDVPGWDLVVTDAGDVWLGRSEWFFVPDNEGYRDWVYARLAPAPAAVTQDKPAPAAPLPLPGVTPPPSVTASLVAIAPQAPDARPLHVVRCTSGGTTVDYPPADQRAELVDVTDLTWLSSQPPRFRADVVVLGYTTVTIPTLFDGCAATGEGRATVAGPDGLSAIYDETAVIVIQHGATIATLPVVATLAAFSRT
jgi:hypothetical protein